MNSKIKDVSKQSLLYVLKQFSERKIAKLLTFLKKLDYKYYIGIIVVAVLIVGGAVYIFRAPQSAEAQWWNITWSYRQAINITNSSDSELTDFQIKILENEDLSALVSAGKLEADLKDLRFTDTNHRVLDYWIEDSTNNSVDVWIKVPSIPTTGTIVYMYYGNSSASDESDSTKIIGNSGNPGLSCTDIKNNRDAATGVYYIKPTGASDEFQAYCDMDTENGGWTQIINLDTNDGTDHWWGDTDFWQGTGTEGSAATSLTTGYKSQAFTDMNTFTEMMFFLHTEGTEVAYGVYDTLEAYQSSSFYDLLNIANSDAGTTITGTLQHQSGASGAPLNTQRSQTRYGDEFVDSFNTEAVVVNRVKRFNTDGVNYMRLATAFDNISYSHTFSGLGVHHERPTGSYITKVEAAPITAYCGNVPRYGSDATATAGFCGTVTSYDRDMAVFVRDSTPDTVSLSIGSPASEENAPGPIGYWNFDEGYGDTAYDSTGYRNDGTISGATWVKNGRKGGALSFDGVDDYVLSELDKTDIGETLSVSMWVRPTGAQSNRVIFSIGDTINAGAPWIYFRRSSSTTVEWYLNGGYRITQSVNDDTWYYMTLTYDGITWRVYKNGVEDGTYVGSLGLNSGNYIWFGIGYHGYFNGLIDEVRIYDRALSANEIKQLYNQGAGSFNVGQTRIPRSCADQLAMNPGSTSGVYTIDPGYGVDPFEVYCDMENDGGGWTLIMQTSDSSSYTYADTVWTNTTGGSTSAGDPNTNQDYVSKAFYTLEGTESMLSLTNSSYWNSWTHSKDTARDLANQSRMSGAQASYGNCTAQTNCGTEPINLKPQGIEQATTGYSGTAWHRFGYVNEDNAWGPDIRVGFSGDGDSSDSSDTVMGLGLRCNGNCATACSTPPAHDTGSGWYIYTGWSVAPLDGATQGFLWIRDDVVTTTHGLVLDMSFESQSGSTTYDESGNENNGTITGATWKTSANCKEGRCFEFDGDGDYIDLGEGNGDFDFGDGNFTVNFWAKLNSHSDSAGFVTKTDGTYWSGIGFSFTTPSSPDSPYFRVVGTSGAIELNTNLGDSYGWKYFTGMRDGNTFKVYIDGVLVNSTTGSIGSIDNDVNLRIGRGNNGYYNGFIDQVKVFNRALTQREIMMEMNNGKPGPVLDMDFNEGGGNTAYDKSGQDNDGTLTNSPTWMTADNCVSGSCLSFDGTDDRVNLGSDNYFSSPTGVTVGAWIYTEDITPSNLKGILGNGNYQTSGYNLTLSTVGTISFSTQSGGNEYVANTYVTDLEGRWIHVVGVFDGSKNILYINGEMKKTLESAEFTVATNPLYIGDSSQGGQYTFDGKIDEVKIYPYALTSQEIKQEYVQSKGQFGQTNSVGTKTNPGASCADILARKINAPDGRYWIDPAGGSISDAFRVYCDMTTDGGGWTLVTNIIDTDANNIPDTVAAVRSGWTETADGVLTSSFQGAGNLGYFIGTTNLDKFDSENIRICALKNKNDKRCYWENLSVGDYTYDNYGGGVGVSSSNNLIKMAAALSGTVEHGDNLNGAHGKFVTDDLSLFKGDSYSGGGYIQQWSGDTANWHVWGFGIAQTNSLTNDREIYNNGASDSGQLREYTAGWEVWLREVATTTISLDPILNMDFDQYSGGVYLDKSGNGYNGTPSGDPVQKGAVHCKEGRCVEFDGVDDYVSFGEDLLTSSPMTICTWFKLDSISQDSVIVGNFSSTHWDSYGKGLKYTNGTLYLMCESSNDKTTISTSLSDTNWHFACGIIKTLDGKLYLDGLEVASGDLNSSGYNYWTDIGAATWRNTENTKNFDGKIDEVKIYDRALTQAEIMELYNGGGPIGHWRFDEGTDNLCSGGADVCDSSGEGNNGTASSSPVWITDTSECKQSGCLDFDGTSDCVALDGFDISDIDSTGDFSVSGWIYKDSLSNYDAMISSGYGGHSYGRWLVGTKNTNPFVSLYGGSSSPTYKQITGNTTLSIGNWYHITSIFSRTDGVIKLYIDGVYDNEVAWDGYLENYQTNKFYIGALYLSNNSTYHFDGKLDDLQLYNYALSESQIKNVYNGGLIKFTP